MVKIDKQENNSNAFIRWIYHRVKWIVAIVLLNFLLKKVVKQKWQDKQYIAHINCTYSYRDFRLLSDTFEDSSKPGC
jgi:hypothetical protein